VRLPAAIKIFTTKDTKEHEENLDNSWRPAREKSKIPMDRAHVER
jgi:hypothetical protein